MKCSTCGAEVPPDQAYCPTCGAAVQADAAQGGAAQPWQQVAPQQPVPQMAQTQQIQMAQTQMSQPPMVQPQTVQPQPGYLTMQVEPTPAARHAAWRMAARAACFASILAIAGALVFTLITILLELVPFASLASAMQNSETGALGGLGDLGDSSGSSSLGAMAQSMLESLQPGIFTLFTLAFAIGIGGTASCSFGMEYSDFLSSYGAPENVSASLTFGGVIGIAGIAMFLGAAFGTYLIAKSGAMCREKGSVIIGGGCTALLTTLLSTLLALAGTHRATASLLLVSITSRYTALTWRSVLAVFVLSGLGAMVGVNMGNRAPGAPSVFHAMWRWMHRQSGYIRTLAEALLFGAAFFLVAGFIHSLLLSYAMSDYIAAHASSSSAAAQWFASNPVKMWVGLIPFVPEVAAYLFFLCCFGTYSLRVIGATDGTSTPAITGELHDLESGAWLGSFPTMSSTWFKWVVFVAFVALTLYLALRAGKRYHADVKSAAWSEAWKAPAVMALVAALLQFGFMILSLRVHTSGFDNNDLLDSLSSGSSVPSLVGAAIAPKPWCFLLPGLWMLLVEALARVAGMRFANRFHFADGGCIYPEAPGTPFAALPCAHEPSDLPDGFDARHVDEAWYAPDAGMMADAMSGGVPGGMQGGMATGMPGAATPYPYQPGYQQPNYPQPGYQPDFQQASYQPMDYQQQGYAAQPNAPYYITDESQLDPYAPTVVPGKPDASDEVMRAMTPQPLADDAARRAQAAGLPQPAPSTPQGYASQQTQLGVQAGAGASAAPRSAWDELANGPGSDTADSMAAGEEHRSAYAQQYDDGQGSDQQ